MAAVGGSIESVSLDGRTFAVPADNEAQRSLGGFSNEVQANGDGSARMVKTRNPWSLEGVTVVVDDTRGDHEFLQSLANAKDYFPVAINLASGKSYQGQGMIAGGEAITASTQATTAEITISGPGNLTKQ